MTAEVHTVRKIIAAMDRPTWVVGPAGTIDAINPAALTTLGYRLDDDVLGLDSHGTFHHSHPDGTAYEASECPLLSPLETGHARGRNVVEWMIRRDGSGFPAAWTTRPVELDGTSMMVLSIDDVSRRVGHASAGTVGTPHGPLYSERAEVFRAVTSYMAAHAYDPDVTPSSVARSYGMSIRLLQNIFAESGESPARYLRRCRVERAAQSLHDGHTPTDVWTLAGFGDESTCRRAFRDHFGTVPSRYLAERTTRDADVSRAG